MLLVPNILGNGKCAGIALEKRGSEIEALEE
jgi:hypothetical protein